MRPALWEKLNPPRGIAAKQLSWERHRRALRMREAGLTLRQMGLRLGVSVERARQLCSPWLVAQHADGRSPIEIWLSGPAGPAMEIIDWWRKHPNPKPPYEEMTMEILE